MLRMISGRKPTVGVWIDMEDADGYKQKHGKPLVTAHITGHKGGSNADLPDVL